MEDDKYYFTMCAGLGIVFGIIFNKLAIGICLGALVGFIMDKYKGNNN